MEVTIPSSPPPQILLDSGLSLEESPGCLRMLLMEVARLQRGWTPHPVRQGSRRVCRQSTVRAYGVGLSQEGGSCLCEDPPAPEVLGKEGL